MCGTADSLMLTQYVCFSNQFNAHPICAVKQTFKCSQNMCGTAESLILTQFVC